MPARTKGRKATKKDKRGSIASIKVDAEFLKALAHELRIQIVAELNKPGRVLSPREFADLAGRRLGTVSYHFRRLEELGAITMVDTRQVRGSTQHFYRATKRMLFDSEEWSSLPTQFKQGVAARALSDYLNASREAIEAGTFDARDDSHMSWATLQLDERGWCKATALMADTLEKLLALEGECRPRVENGAESLNATFGLGLYEAPSQDHARGDEPTA